MGLGPGMANRTDGLGMWQIEAGGSRILENHTCLMLGFPRSGPRPYAVRGMRYPALDAVRGTRYPALDAVRGTQPRSNRGWTAVGPRSESPAQNGHKDLQSGRQGSRIGPNECSSRSRAFETSPVFRNLATAQNMFVWDRVAHERYLACQRPSASPLQGSAVMCSWKSLGIHSSTCFWCKDLSETLQNGAGILLDRFAGETVDVALD